MVRNSKLSALWMVLVALLAACSNPTATPVAVSAATAIPAATATATHALSASGTATPTTEPVDTYMYRQYNGVTYTVTAKTADRLTARPQDGTNRDGQSMIVFYDRSTDTWTIVASFSNTHSWVLGAYSVDGKSKNREPEYLASYGSCMVNGRGLTHVVISHCSLLTVKGITSLKIAGTVINAGQFVSSSWDGKNDAAIAPYVPTKTPTATGTVTNTPWLCPVAGYKPIDYTALTGWKFNGSPVSVYVRSTRWDPGYKIIPVKNAAGQVFSVALMVCPDKKIYMDLAGMPTPLPTMTTSPTFDWTPNP